MSGQIGNGKNWRSPENQKKPTDQLNNQKTFELRSCKYRNVAPVNNQMLRPEICETSYSNQLTGT